MPRYRGAVLAVIGFTIAGLGLVLRGSLPEGVLGPFLMSGVAVAIAGCGLAGYDYSRRSGAVLLERGIWQGPGPVRAPPALLRDALPEFVDELRGLMRTEGHGELAGQLDHLQLVDRCRCGDDFCATFYTRPRPEGPWGPGHETIVLDPAVGIVNLDLVAESIVSIEALYRDDVKARLASVCP